MVCRPCDVNDRIELLDMPDDPNPIPPGTQGVVTAVHYINGMGFWQIQVDWDNGRSLMLSIPPDEIRVL